MVQAVHVVFFHVLGIVYVASNTFKVFFFQLYWVVLRSFKLFELFYVVFICLRLFCPALGQRSFFVFW